MSIKEAIAILEKDYKSSKGFMGVKLDNVNNLEDLFENVKDEIFSISEIIEHSDIEEEFGMTVREARGYVKKLNNFVVKYG